MSIGRGWLPLAVPLGGLLVLAAMASRERWPSVVGDEATYLMAAQSLAHDRDLRYQRADWDRFVRTFGVAPEGLILQSTDQGRTLVYGKPVFYPLAIAAFVRLAGLPGVRVANVLLLALASAAAAWALRGAGEDRAPGASSSAAWVAVLVFGSVLFTQSLWAHADLFYACCVAIAYALVYGPRPHESLPRRRFDLRLAAALCLLVVVVIGRPFYAPLLLPVLVHAGARERALVRLALPALALALVVLVSDIAVRGTFSAYAGERQAFYGYTGFPDALPQGGESPRWQTTVSAHGPNSWVGRFALTQTVDLRLLLWDVVYFLAGRHVGLVPYFLPALVCLLLYRPGGGRTVLLLAIACAVAIFFVVRPFNFWGGGGAIGNRYFLPLYPACWFLVARRPRPPAIAAALLVGALFLYPAWLRPHQFLRAADGSYSFVSGPARRLLPYETTQNHLKPAGVEDLSHRGLWIKPLTPNVKDASTTEPAIEWTAGRPAELLVGVDQAARPVAALSLCGRPPSTGERLKVSGSVEAVAALPEPGCWSITLGRARARHPMWWSDRDYSLYRLRIAVPEEHQGSAVQLILRAPENVDT